MEKFIEVPFGAKDSELVGWEYTIPEGYTANIENGKIIVKKEESEDESIRKMCMKYLDREYQHCSFVDDRKMIEKCIAWLEKKGEQNSVDKVEPKFKAGDWIIDIQDGAILHINKALEHAYEVMNLEGGSYEVSRCSIETCNRLWTLKDAKDGDVLQLGKFTAIFKRLVSNENCICYCSIYCSVYEGKFEIPCQDDNNYGFYDATPATKEQRDLLFQKIKEAGFYWDVDKKELRKIHLKRARCVDKVEQKSAWSEEDENKVTIFMQLTEGCDNEDELADWLKSLKERYAWKPSDEQLDALYTYIHNPSIFNSSDPRMELVESVYKDLKKLREK